MKLLSHWRTDKSFFLYTDSSGIGGSWTSPWISWVTQELINLSYAWFFFGSSWRSHKALESLKKNWQISFPCCCNLLVFSSLSVGSWKVANFFLSWLLSSLIFLLSQNSPSCFSVSYIPPSFIGSFPLLGFFLFLFLFMFHLQGFGVLLLLWVMSVKVESMNVVTETRDIWYVYGWNEKMQLSRKIFGGCFELQFWQALVGIMPAILFQIHICQHSSMYVWQISGILLSLMCELIVCR
jgi:hypothetical protein